MKQSCYLRIASDYLDEARYFPSITAACDDFEKSAREELKAALEARLPALLADFRSAVEAAGFLWSAPKGDA
jgi:hypothetical protein